MKLDLKSLRFPEIESWVTEELKEPRYRAQQLIDWLFVKGVTSFREMTNLPKTLRERLEEIASITYLSVRVKRCSRDGRTIKFLYLARDGAGIETVFMRHPWGRTVCVSTQVGCRMGCRFCASGAKGLKRNLSAGEIYEQVLRTQVELGERVTHVVLMGMGEPFDNQEATFRFLENITHPAGLNIGARKITISTCGVVPGIRALAQLKRQFGLAVSLHAPRDELRSWLLPINRRYPLKELLAACWEYVEATHRRITFAYTMIAGINDGQEEARELARLLKGLLCHVNLIPFNLVNERRFRPPSPARIEAFCRILEENGIPATVRRSRGEEIEAACGQLRYRYEEEGLLTGEAEENGMGSQE
ncbi:radical SAM enzyme, Cfr family [Ammonifex degensii KC4]|uniref:Probable dual-specificity RNA methyltransferase RlmN n=1 Tax=Ammonifex degensii (strain DSM 10501 / KC4) TaxID=429009 RepID=C9R7Z1_AMMDK|nr:23S rRNA (adenine(2503)-C(2))-methyltransferase RlmN [Ammonifex degensii]ACX52420.1 radical SAM enzyme, Cfr family [Ammonifex degensii KC4]